MLSGVQDVLEAYHQKWLNWKVSETTKTTGEPLAPPPRPDFKELAKQNGLTYHEISPASAWEIKPFDISASTVGTGSTDVGSGTPFIVFVFETATEFRPALSQDTLGNSYLFWRIEEIADRVPSFDDPGVADQVLKTWKRVQARTRARDEAKGLAEEARKAQKSLTRAFGTRPGLVVTKTEPFSWMSFGAIPPRFATQQSRPQISEVRGVDRPGDQFMKVAFDLAQGDVGVAPNQPETVYYVLRAVDFTPSTDELWNSFRDGADLQSIYSVALRDQQESYRAWRNDLNASGGGGGGGGEPVRARAE